MPAAIRGKPGWARPTCRNATTVTSRSGSTVPRRTSTACCGSLGHYLAVFAERRIYNRREPPSGRDAGRERSMAVPADIRRRYAVACHLPLAGSYAVPLTIAGPQHSGRPSDRRKHDPPHAARDDAGLHRARGAASRLATPRRVNDSLCKYGLGWRKGSTTRMEVSTPPPLALPSIEKAVGRPG